MGRRADRGCVGLPALVLADWQYAGHGHTPGESALAGTIARGLQLNRETAREALQEQLVLEGAAE